jgi:GNAT superfamily N-acetyltransferase
MDIIIREADLSDSPELSRLAEQLGYPCEDSRIRSNLVELENDPDYAVFVATRKDGSLAGFCHVFVSRRLFLRAFTELGGLVVDDQERGRGIGRMLVDVCERWAVERGHQEMRVRSNLLREGARRFYLATGYSDSKHQAVYLKNLAG